MEEVKSKIKNPFTGKDQNQVWAELMARPSKPADKTKILEELACKIKTKRQKN